MLGLVLENWAPDGKSGYTTLKSLKSYWGQNCEIFEEDLLCS